MATADVVTVASGETGNLFKNARLVMGAQVVGNFVGMDHGINDVSSSGQMEARLTNRFDDPDYYGN
jgi:hypothetical protein